LVGVIAALTLPLDATEKKEDGEESEEIPDRLEDDCGEDIILEIHNREGVSENALATTPARGVAGASTVEGMVCVIARTKKLLSLKARGTVRFKFGNSRCRRETPLTS